MPDGTMSAGGAAVAETDMSFRPHWVTHLPPRCDRAYRRNRNRSATEHRQLRNDPSKDRTRPRQQRPDSRQTAARGGAVSVRIAVDIGGTFTDATLIDEVTGRVAIAKVLSTPA